MIKLPLKYEAETMNMASKEKKELRIQELIKKKEVLAEYVVTMNIKIDLELAKLLRDIIKLYSRTENLRLFL